MSSWHDLVTASLIGTERAVVPAVAIPGLPSVAEDARDPAAVLLDQAALLTAARRAGRPPDRAEPLPACEPDPRPAVNPAAGRRLARILDGEHAYLLAEWLAALARRGLRPPAESLPALLDRARRADPGLRSLVAEAGGPRASWLARLNPDWGFVIAPVLAGQDAWRLGDPAQRRSYLAGLRSRDPGAARELIAASWRGAARDRVMFLSVLADNLSLADEPLLENALADPADDIRVRAAYLLASLPGSALGERMVTRARGLLRLHQGIHGKRLVINPARRDGSMRQDGITLVSVVTQADRAHLILEVMARTPLRTWTGDFGLTPAEVVALPAGSWAPALLAGWSRAAVAQRDHDWMDALTRRALTGPPPGSGLEIHALQQLARRADPALGAPDAVPGSRRDTPAAIVLKFRYEMLKELDDDDAY
ncbi:MAG TPA: DUF5691 domain-containing protein [Streptosporangiaceae bacterium]|nr:DUF5691 domain-containing protein [Streptosporangiaceae bacterium]